MGTFAPPAPAGLKAGFEGSPADARRVVLIGYQDQGNLGVGYLAAVLERAGYQADMLDVRAERTAIARDLLDRPPLLVGFSLIFQFFLPQYRALASFLRSVGVTCHFTIGGHYASLCFEELLNHFPEIDSVVRYEGEETLLELAGRLRTGEDWQDIAGIAFSGDAGPFATEARPLVPDLDSLPFPRRPFEVERIAGFATLPVLASRGCIRRCSFCSIHTFYRTAPGKVVRVRRPEKVIEEMLDLQRERGVRVFLFQDDDFPLWGNKGRRWADELVGRMHDSGLARTTIWKISCRSEYVEPELFESLREAGLFLVYMGIESGVETGLEILFKQMTIGQNIGAVERLKQLEIAFAYGFMLFDPSSTFESVRENVGFLRRIVGDGSAAAVFSRMLPYGGTPIRDQLAKEGRLRGDLQRPDYDFLDRRLNDYHARLTRAVRPWIHNQGLSYALTNSADELEAVSRLCPGVLGAEDYRAALRRLTAACNAELFALVERSSLAYEQGDFTSLDPRPIGAFCEARQADLMALRSAFLETNVDRLIDNILAQGQPAPVLMPQIH